MMKFALLLSFWLLALLGRSIEAAENGGSIKQSIIGFWKATVMETKGRKQQGSANLVMEVTDTVMIYHGLTGENQGLATAYKLDETKTPVHLDMTNTHKGKSIITKAIIRIDGNRLSICADGGIEQPRPTGFETKGNPNLIILNYERTTEPVVPELPDGPETIEALNQLRALGVNATPDKDQKVRTLIFAGSRVTDEQLELLGSLPGLETVSLLGSNIGDAGVPHLAGLSRLKQLNLTNTAITDLGIGRIANLGSLEILTLTGTRITNESILYLGKFKKLKELNVSGTGITTDGIERLKQQLPNCVVK